MMANQSIRKPTIAVTPEQYTTLAQQSTPKPTIVKNVVRAFVVGGIICAIGQVIINLYATFGLAHLEASTAATATMVFIGALLTGLGIYDEIGKFGGAGPLSRSRGLLTPLSRLPWNLSEKAMCWGLEQSCSRLPVLFLCMGCLHRLS